MLQVQRPCSYLLLVSLCFSCSGSKTDSGTQDAQPGGEPEASQSQPSSNNETANEPDAQGTAAMDGSGANGTDTTSGTAEPDTSTQNTNEPEPQSASDGNGPSVAGCPVFPQDNPWNTDISALPVHANSDNFVDSVGRDTGMHPDFGTEWEGAPIGIPYVVVDSGQQMVPINYTAYGDESDPGPMPIPLDAPVEGGPSGDGDRHTLVIDQDSCTLYELYRAFPADDGASWEADSGTVWDLTRNEYHPEGCTSADAAGLPVFPGLARYDEVVEQGEVLHALRFTVSRSQRAYIFPASHYASSNTDANLPPMGLRFRMKANYDCSGYSSEVQVLCTAMKRFGLIVADNGSDWYVSGAPDPRWSDDNLHDLGNITGDAFEVVDTGDQIVTNAPDCSTN